MGFNSTFKLTFTFDLKNTFSCQSKIKLCGTYDSFLIKRKVTFLFYKIDSDFRYNMFPGCLEF